MKEREYMYVFVRQDLSIPQQIVQASHVCAYVGSSFHPDTSIVLLECPNINYLKYIADYMSENSIKFRMFYETDISEHTAIASEPISGEDRKIFRKFNLYTIKKEA